MRFAVGLVSFIMLLACECAFALDPSLDVSQYAHTSWKVREGFAKGQIGWITQTPDGYLWLGTEFGLLRFDGVRVVQWQPPSGERLPSNWIGPLLVAHDGTLWIGTLKGLASWKEGKLTQYREVAGAYILSIVEARDRTIWLAVSEASKGRLCAIRDGKVECYGEGMFGNAVVAIYQDHNGILWATSQAGLWRWAPGPQKQYAFPHGVIEANSLIEDDAGALLLATNGGLKQFAAGKIENYPLPGISGQFRPSRFFRCSDGSLWIGTGQGLLHLHQGRVDRFSAVDGLSGDSAGGIFEDREGNVWVGTTDGLDRFREYAIPTTSRNQGLPNSYVGSVQATPDGGIWIDTPDGLNRWANARMTVYRGRPALGQNRHTDETKVGGVGTHIANSGLAGTTLSLGLDDAGRLWVSTGDGVFYFERNRFVRVQGIPGYALSITGDGHGKVWTLHNKEGVFCWSPNAPTRHISWSQFAQKIPRTMLPDREPGSLWLGFFNGGLVYLKDGKIVRSYGAADGLGGRVNHLRFGPNGGLWVSTEGGLSRIKDGHIATMTPKNGLPCDEVHWSMEDEDHAAWLYMPCGLVRIARSELDTWINDPTHVLKTTVFDNSDGVRSVGIYGNYGPRVTKSPDGRIWFVPGDGVSVIDPRHMPFNKLPPPVHIEQIVADHTVSSEERKLPLPARIHDLQIDYTALSFVAPEKVLFRYKLEGWDHDWQDVGTRRQAFYSNLAPRDYTFRVMACNNSGVWNEAGTSLNFFVAPAFYQTWWFRSVCVVAFLGLLIALYQLRVSQLSRLFNMRLEGRVAERTRIARELHDTLLQSFQGALLKFNAVTYMLVDRPEVQKTLESAIDQARQSITEGRDTVQGMRSSTLVGNDLARALGMLGEDLAGENSNGKAPEFCVQVNGTTRDLAPIVRDEVCRIASEALRNAFQHAHARRIEVEIHYDRRRFRLRVRDDGKGIDPKVLDAGARAGHYGLPGMHERAKLVGGKLAVWSELDSGTETELTIPASIAYAKSVAARWPKVWRKGA
jgi:signal transduction histidine kinase/ligand-binding sensor domain-containing protein